MSSFKHQVQYINSPEFIRELVSKSIYSEQEIKEKTQIIITSNSLEDVFKHLNIKYIAPYEFSDIENECSKFNYIASQVVLEHIPPAILETLFQKTKKWLTHNGFAAHTINFIDHFANPGFFQDRSISEFNFLKYSDKYWKFWAGNSIAYTNRLSYMYYLDLAKKHNLTIVNFKGENYREHVILDEKLIHPDVIKKYDHDIEEIGNLMKYQRGTLILSL